MFIGCCFENIIENINQRRGQILNTIERKSVTSELNQESGDRYTTIHFIGLESTLRKEKITNSALCVIVCLVEIMVRCDL